MSGQFPNPSTQFKPGVSGNPGGKSRKHRQAEVKAAEISAQTRLELVEAFAALVANNATPEQKYSLVNSEALKLLKESEDRGFGTPKSSLDLSSDDGTMSPVDHQGAVLAALRAKSGGDAT